MSFPNLATRQVVLGQALPVRFRRVHSFVVSASGERLVRPTRPTLQPKPALRETPRFERTAEVEDRQRTPEEVESVYAGTQLAQEVLPDSEEGNDPTSDLTDAPAALEFLSDESSDLWNEVDGDMKGPGNAQEGEDGRESEMNSGGKVLVVKRPALQKPTAPKRMEEKKRAEIAEREIVHRAMQSHRKPKRMDVEAATFAEEERPKVIVAKRPARRDLPPPPPPPPLPSDPIAKRVDNVLVVSRSASGKTQVPQSRSEEGIVGEGVDESVQSRDVTGQDRSETVAASAPVLVRPRPRPITRPLPHKSTVTGVQSSPQVADAKPPPVPPQDVRNDQLLKDDSVLPAIVSDQLTSPVPAEEAKAEIPEKVSEAEEQDSSSVKKADDIRSSLLQTVKKLHEEGEKQMPETEIESTVQKTDSRAAPPQSPPRLAPPPKKPATKPRLPGFGEIPILRDVFAKRNRNSVQEKPAAEEQEETVVDHQEATSPPVPPLRRPVARARAQVQQPVEETSPPEKHTAKEIRASLLKAVEKLHERDGAAKTPTAPPETETKDSDALPPLRRPVARSNIQRQPIQETPTPEQHTANEIRASLLKAVEKLHEHDNVLPSSPAAPPETQIKDSAATPPLQPPVAPDRIQEEPVKQATPPDTQTAEEIRASLLKTAEKLHEQHEAPSSNLEAPAETETKSPEALPPLQRPVAPRPAQEPPVKETPPLDTQQGMKIRESLLKAAEKLHEQDQAPASSPSPSLDTDRKTPAPVPPLGAPVAPRVPPSGGSALVRPTPPMDGTPAPVNAAPVNAAPSAPQTLDQSIPKLQPPPRAIRPTRVDVQAKSVPPLAGKPAAKPTDSPSRLNSIEVDRQYIQEKTKKTRAEYLKKLEELKEKKRQEREKIWQDRKLKRASDAALIGNRRRARQGRQIRRRKSSGGDAVGDSIIEVGSDGLSVEALAATLAISPAEIIKVLFVKGVMVTVNQTLDVDSVKVVAAELGVDVVDRDENGVADLAKKEGSFCEDDDELATDRPPVVTVMGHVDHGKTSLLDYIRNTTVVKGEAGGITQAIGAYTCSVEVEGEERTICFLDTPGHEAFSAMRARGTRVTDIAIIIVAANDGIRPQTLEAISHAKAAEVPLLIAINKIDVPGADPERVKRELSEIELLPEECGGKTPVVEISAKTGEGVTDLLEMLTLVADIQLNLIANPDAPAKGTVIEAFLDKRSGVLATVLVQNGSLHVGDAIVAGGAFGKVRSLVTAAGVSVEEAGPSVAVQMLGFHDLPIAGDLFSVCRDEAQAKEEAEKVSQNLRARHLAESAAGGSMVTLSSLASVDDDDATALQRINLVLKADTSGSLEAVKGALAKLPQEAIMIRYLHAAPGEVTESDVLLAATAEGMIVGFNVPPSEAVKSVAKQRGVALESYSVIYHLIDDVRAVMEGRLSPTDDCIAIGQAEVRAVFGAGSRRVAGCMVTEGRLEKGSVVRIMRKQQCVCECNVTSLRRVKEDVDEVTAGLECGVGCADYSDWQEGDRIEAFTVTQKRVTLEESHATMAVDQEELQQLIGQSA